MSSTAGPRHPPPTPISARQRLAHRRRWRFSPGSGLVPETRWMRSVTTRLGGGGAGATSIFRVRPTLIQVFWAEVHHGRKSKCLFSTLGERFSEPPSGRHFTAAVFIEILIRSLSDVVFPGGSLRPETLPPPPVFIPAPPSDPVGCFSGDVGGAGHPRERRGRKGCEGERMEADERAPASSLEPLSPLFSSVLEI